MITPLECEKRGARIDSDAGRLLQPLLGTDKRNPVFSLYRDEKTQPQSLHLYYGAELLEIVPEDSERIAFKLLAGRLYNAGVKALSLQRVFGVDRKTLQRWGRGLRCDDPEELVRALSGRGGHRKLTPQIRSFITVRFPEVYRPRRTGYSQRIRSEIQQVFGVEISGETLRPLFKQLKRELPKELPLPATEPDLQKRETACERSPAPTPPCSPDPSAQPPPQLAAAESAPRELRKQSPDLSTPSREVRARFSHHLGVLLFSSILSALEKELENCGWLLKQWLATLLLGAINIAQTKRLDFADLHRLLGRTLRSLFPQRSQWTRIAASDALARLLAFNARQIGLPPSSGDFYFDPHSKHDTGMQKVLKGWCPSIRWADKVLHTDFLHTAQGQPVYLACTDNYQDLRERFWEVLQRFRQDLALPAQAVLSRVVDRGIFSHQVFEKIITAPEFHLITWEKDYRKGQWQTHQVTGSFVLERTRNHAQDKRLYRFEYIDQPWAKDPQMRQLMVRATNPKERTIELGILSDEHQRPASQLLGLMFSRWTQENDFKYLDAHFGINPITSYASVAYQQLREQLQDKQIKSGAYKAIEEQARQSKSQLSKLLLAEQQHPKKSAPRTTRIDALSQELQQLAEQKSQTQKEISRLQALIEQQMVRLDTKNKSVMDSLKIIARNAFYRTLQPFKAADNNYRDDHELFRNLTQAHGMVVESAQHVDVHLLPTVNYPPKLEKLVQELLTQINTSQPQMPDGTGRRLQFYLGNKSGIQLAIGS